MNKISRTTKHESRNMSVRRNFNKGGKYGFTLIEIITALAIMAIGLLSILALFPVGFHASKRAADFTQATLLAQNKMEEIKMKGFSGKPVSSPGEKGIFRWNIPPAKDVPGYDNLKEVTVKVSWSERGQTYEQEFKTYIADYAP